MKFNDKQETLERGSDLIFFLLCLCSRGIVISIMSHVYIALLY